MNLLRSCLCTVGGSWSTRREPAHADESADDFSPVRVPGSNIFEFISEGLAVSEWLAMFLTHLYTCTCSYTLTSVVMVTPWSMWYLCWKWMEYTSYCQCSLGWAYAQLLLVDCSCQSYLFNSVVYNCTEIKCYQYWSSARLWAWLVSSHKLLYIVQYSLLLCWLDETNLNHSEFFDWHTPHCKC